MYQLLGQCFGYQLCFMFMPSAYMHKYTYICTRSIRYINVQNKHAYDDFLTEGYKEDPYLANIIPIFFPPFYFCIFFFDLWIISEYITPPEQIRKSNMLLFNVLSLFTVQ